MSDGYRDKRRRTRSGKICPDSQNGGCVWERTGEYKRIDRRKDRHLAKVELRHV